MEEVWKTIRGLTYAEMIRLATRLRDVSEAVGLDQSDAHSWARVLNDATLWQDEEDDA